MSTQKQVHLQGKHDIYVQMSCVEEYPYNHVYMYLYLSISISIE